jgi:hypothetical protein
MSQMFQIHLKYQKSPNHQKRQSFLMYLSHQKDPKNPMSRLLQKHRYPLMPHLHHLLLNYLMYLTL